MPEPIDGALVQRIRYARQFALEQCHKEVGGDCSWYHGTWPYLRALGVIKTAGGHATFFAETLQALASNAGARAVLISGAADDAMAMIATTAFRDARAPLDLTIVDRCETPLALSRWSAERTGAKLHTYHSEIAEFRPQAPFDVVMTSSLLAFIPLAERPRLFAHWASLLRPGGKLLLTNRLRPAASAAPIGFSADQAKAFCAKVRREAERSQPLLGVDPRELEGWASAYAERMKAFPVRSVDEVIELLERAGFAPDRVDTAHFPGVAGSERPSGPSSVHPGDYVRVLATRM